MDRSDFQAAFALPFARDSSLDTVAVGVLVTLAAFATPLSGVVLAGYVVRLVRAGRRDATALPAFDDVLDMTIDGARLSVVLVALQAPGVVLATVVLGSSRTPVSLVAALSDPRLLTYAGLSAFDVGGLVVAGIAAFVGTYLATTATVALAAEGSLVASIPVTRTLASDTSFASLVSATMLVVFGGRILGSLSGAVPLVGSVLTACVSFLTLVVAATLLGRGTTRDRTPSEQTDGLVFDATGSV